MAKHEAILSWFKGKARINAQAALDALDKSVEQGEWLPKVSRTVRAALNKCSVAQQYGRAYSNVLAEFGKDPSKPYSLSLGWRAVHEMSYGCYTNAQKIDYAAIRATIPATEAGALEVLAEVERWAGDFAGIAEQMAKLDATRPKPVFTSLGISPTVTRTLVSLGMENTVASTVRVCEMEWETIEYLDKDGSKKWKRVGRLLWPEGTVHGASRYHWSANDNSQCQACGHAIKSPWNWVPLIIDNAAGVPHSLWVGRDCCQKLFGIKVTGDVELIRDKA